MDYVHSQPGYPPTHHPPCGQRVDLVGVRVAVRVALVVKAVCFPIATAMATLISWQLVFCGWEARPS